MKKKIYITVSIFIFLIAYLLYLFYSNTLDIKNVDKQLIDVTKNVTTVEKSYYLDGGSIGVHLFQGNKKVATIFIPVIDKYKYYYITQDIDNITEEKHQLNKDSKNYILNLMDEKCSQIYYSEQYKLSKSPIYLMKSIFNKLTN